MKILFLTTNSLATNPRLYKEILLAKQSGFLPKVICFEFNNWSKEINEALITKLNGVEVISIPAGRSPYFIWFRSVVTETVFRIMGKFISLPLPALSQAVSRRSNLIIETLDKVSKADWVIGHNPGAIWPALSAAKKFNCKVGFDVEDYHAGEGHNKYIQSLTRKLMVATLPKMNYVSFASPLIMQRVKADMKFDKGNWFVVLNYFPISDFKVPISLIKEPAKMVWFSQNINAGRGLELILPFVKKANGKVELHLVGNLDTGFYEKCLKGISNIIIHPPMPQNELHHSLDNYDIGLALEPAKDVNNQLAISNKIMAYLQAGLFIMATNTPAQETLLKDLPGHGVCIDYRNDNAELVFEKTLTELNVIRGQRTMRYKSFENRNWETVSMDLLTEWNR